MAMAMAVPSTQGLEDKLLFIFLIVSFKRFESFDESDEWKENFQLKPN